MSDRAVFFTGAGGFIGRYILQQYLQKTDVDLYLLENGRFCDRLKQFLETLNIDQAARDRVRIVLGDITVSGLGLDAKMAAEIKSRLTDAIHLAALYNLAAPREESMKANVDGTRNVLDFVGAAPNLRRLGHMSTIAISGTYTGVYTENDFDKGQQFKNYYEETKFLSEKLVRERWNEIPSIIGRPTVVVGHSKTGHIEKVDGPYYALTMISRNMHLIAPDSGRTLCHIVPVDYVADGFFALFEGAGDTQKVYCLGDPNPLSYNEFFDVACETWPKPKTILRLSPTLIAPLARLSIFEKASGVPYQAFMYTSNPVEYTMNNAISALSPLGIKCPTVREYIGVMIKYFRDHYRDPAVRRGNWKTATT